MILSWVDSHKDGKGWRALVLEDKQRELGLLSLIRYIIALLQGLTGDCHENGAGLFTMVGNEQIETWGVRTEQEKTLLHVEVRQAWVAPERLCSHHPRKVLQGETE